MEEKIYKAVNNESEDVSNDKNIGDFISQICSDQYMMEVFLHGSMMRKEVNGSPSQENKNASEVITSDGRTFRARLDIQKIINKFILSPDIKKLPNKILTRCLSGEGRISLRIDEIKRDRVQSNCTGTPHKQINSNTPGNAEYLISLCYNEKHENKFHELMSMTCSINSGSHYDRSFSKGAMLDATMRAADSEYNSKYNNITSYDYFFLIWDKLQFKEAIIDQNVFTIPVPLSPKPVDLQSLHNVPFNHLLEAADKHDPLAQLNLGICYFYGMGVTKNQQQAVVWYRLAADQNNALAQLNLGLCYAHGRGVDKDEVQAAVQYQLAADQGNVLAQFNLAMCYVQGKGVSKDLEQTAIWYERLSAQLNLLKNPSNETYLGIINDIFNKIGLYTKALDSNNALSAQEQQELNFFTLSECYKQSFESLKLQLKYEVTQIMGKELQQIPHASDKLKLPLKNGEKSTSAEVRILMENIEDILLLDPIKNCCLTLDFYYMLASAYVKNINSDFLKKLNSFKTSKEINDLFLSYSTEEEQNSLFVTLDDLCEDIMEAPALDLLYEFLLNYSNPLLEDKFETKANKDLEPLQNSPDKSDQLKQLATTGTQSQNSSAFFCTQTYSSTSTSSSGMKNE